MKEAKVEIDSMIREEIIPVLERLIGKTSSKINIPFLVWNKNLITEFAAQNRLLLRY